MNMTASTNSMPQTSQYQPMDVMIHQEIDAISALNVQHRQQVLDYSKGFLDKIFPLATGSHKEVCSYVVYYQHVLAFFADGSHSGLANPAQFVALCGSRERPQSLLLKDQQRHVEISFCRSGQHGSQDKAGIEDIQLELQQDNGSQWFSMMQGRLQQDQIKTCPMNASFTAKDGSDYQI